MHTTGGSRQVALEESNNGQSVMVCTSADQESEDQNDTQHFLQTTTNQILQRNRPAIEQFEPFLRLKSRFPVELRRRLRILAVPNLHRNAILEARQWLFTLDCNQHTEDHVRAVVECFPESLVDVTGDDALLRIRSRPRGHMLLIGYDTYTPEDSTLPIVEACGFHVTRRQGWRGELTERKWIPNINALPFVPLLATLGRKHYPELYTTTSETPNSDSHLRTVLEHLTRCTGDYVGETPEEHRVLDERTALVLNQLWNSGLLTPELVGRYHLVDLCFRWDVHQTERRLSCLVRIQPNSLGPLNRETPTHKHARARGDTLLHAAIKSPAHQNSMAAFWYVLELALDVCETDDLGFLFHSNERGRTPYHLACTLFGTQKTLGLVRRATGSLVSPETLVKAASDPAIHFESLWFQLKHCPWLARGCGSTASEASSEASTTDQHALTQTSGTPSSTLRNPVTYSPPMDPPLRALGFVPVPKRATVGVFDPGLRRALSYRPGGDDRNDKKRPSNEFGRCPTRQRRVTPDGGDGFDSNARNSVWVASRPAADGSGVS